MQVGKGNLLERIQFYVKSLHLKTRFFAFISTRVFDLYIATHQPQCHALLLGK
jgi:hypothetical protein